MHEPNNSESLLDALQRNHGPLRSMLIGRLGDEDAASDLLQEAYLRCAELNRTAAVDNPKSYVWRLAINLAIDHQRSTRRRELLHRSDQAAIERAHTGSASPEESVLVGAYLRDFRTAMDEIPADSRRAYILSRRDGMTYSDIALEMGVSPNMVKKHVKRAIAVLRLALEGHLGPGNR